MPGLIGSSCCGICINFICNIAVVATSCSGRRLWHCECCLNSPQNRHQCATAAAEEAAATRWNFATRPRFADRLEKEETRRSPKKVPLKYEKIYLATSRASSSLVVVSSPDRRSPIADRLWSVVRFLMSSRSRQKNRQKSSTSRSLFIWERHRNWK